MIQTTKPEISDSEKIQKLRQLLKTTIDWYKEHKANEASDSSYLYDITVEHLTDNLTRSDAMILIETLS